MEVNTRGIRHGLSHVIILVAIVCCALWLVRGALNRPVEPAASLDAEAKKGPPGLPVLDQPVSPAQAERNPEPLPLIEIKDSYGTIRFLDKAGEHVPSSRGYIVWRMTAPSQLSERDSAINNDI